MDTVAWTGTSNPAETFVQARRHPPADALIYDRPYDFSPTVQFTLCLSLSFIPNPLHVDIKRTYTKYPHERNVDFHSLFENSIPQVREKRATKVDIRKLYGDIIIC